MLRGVAVAGGFWRSEAAVLEAEAFGFRGGGVDDGGVDDHAAVFRCFGWDALGGESWTEDRD